ncbi:MAG: NADH-quinone oxidoreductase subunit NuoN [Rhodobacteraceae bacterium]|nr:NADH-quinone oxidoreductase subunit NuoN [Paracoccaceae bacterium]
MSTLTSDMAAALPEILLALGGMVILMLGVFRGGAGPASELAAARLAHFSAIILLAVVGAMTAMSDGAGSAFGGLYISDGFSGFAKVLILFGAAALLWLGMDYLERHRILKFEYPVLVVFATLGMCMMVSANDLIALYMGIELQSLALYVIAAFHRDNLRSTEAGLKYFVLGALSSGLLLYGASLIYGYSGSTQFAAIGEAMAGSERPVGLLIGLAFLIAGLAFKISAAPFHMWTPDVYEGAPAPVTAFFATAPKIAAGALFARVMLSPFGEMSDAWVQILAFLALCSMFLGAFAGIGQRNIKRLMAYSSIGHMGFALVGLAAGGEAGATALLVYLAIYLVMNLGVFGFILMMTRGGLQVAELDDLKGLARTHPASAAGIAVLMFSLAGIPPLAGFFAKYFVFSAAVAAGLGWLAVAGVVASVISAFYYLAIVKRMYFDEAGEPLELAGGISQRLALGLSAVAMILAVAPFEPFNGFGAPEAAASAAAALLR